MHQGARPPPSRCRPSSVVWALSTKALAALALIPLVQIAFAGRRGAPFVQRVKASTLFGIIVPLPGLAWYVRAELESGNPLFPSPY